MLVSPLFDFILASVRDHEVGSASGVLNAAQQLASAIGVAAIGTVFFSTLGRSGFTAAIRQCLMIELGVAAVLLVLARALPRRPRDAQTAEIRLAPADSGNRQAPYDDARPGLAVLAIEPGQRLIGTVVPGSCQAAVNDFPLAGPTVSSE
jgi:hypothetical protein